MIFKLIHANKGWGHMAWELFAFKAYREVLVTLSKDDMSKSILRLNRINIRTMFWQEARSVGV